MNIELSKILKRPIITEKSNALKESVNQVVFEVYPEATKSMIKAAVEKAFQVKVLSVNTLMVPGKTKRNYTKRRRAESKISNWKKAIVTLKEGNTIDVVEGV